MKINKDLILESAFELFYVYGYKEMSISLLQERLNIGRATLYYYFKSKEDLLISAVENYYINEFDIFYDSLKDNLSIEKLIHEFVDYYGDLYKRLRKYNNNDEYVFIKLFSLFNYSATNFPAIKERLKSTRVRKYKLWKKAVECSYKNNEIKKDIDIELITSLFFGITYETYQDNDKNVLSDIESLDGYKKSCLLLYNLIRN